MKPGTRSILGVTLALLTVIAWADLVIAPTAEDVKPIQVGDPAPSFTVRHVDGSSFDFRPRDLSRPAMLITFRGGWCPFCNQHLKELRHVMPELKESGVDVLFLSADRPEILYSSLQEDAQDLDYVILSDATMEASSALGVAFRVADKDVARMKGYGIDLAKATGSDLQALPVPAVFLIDVDGVVQFAHTNPDYTKRLSAEEVRTAAKSVL